MSPLPAEVLHASDRLKAVLHRGTGSDAIGGGPLVITFDSLGHDLSLDRPGFGQEWLGQTGFDAVHIVSARNDWYQAPDLLELLQAVRTRAAAYPWAVTYGSSMGGYAAIRFGGRAGARRAIALSPQFSIDPALSGVDDRWAEYADRIAFLWEQAAPDDVALETAYVVYDPLNPDRLHAEALAAAYPVHPVPLPHAGHPSGALLAETGLLSKAVLDMIEGRLDAPGLARAVKAGRTRSASAYYNLAERQPRHRGRLATRLAARAVQLSPEGAGYVGAYARRLTAEGRMAEAEPLHRRALSLFPLEPMLQLQLADFLAKRGGAAEEVEELIGGWARGAPRGLKGRLRACTILMRAGAFEAARREAREARRTHPGSVKAHALATGLGMALATPWIGRRVLEHLWRRRRAAVVKP